ncbi:MAG TPA: glutamine synthetase type III, partial [Flavobacteriales bacterium]|nr:glutamine synthetase type III [Flavobacteriales bacterium]
ELGVFNEREIEARYEIELENYILKLQIEARVLGDIAQNHILPASIEYLNKLTQNVKNLKEIFSEKEFETIAKTQIELIKTISGHITQVKSLVDAMIEERKKANKLEDTVKKAEAYAYKVKPYFDKIKYHADKLEINVDDEMWPLPKLREMLFTR